MILLLLHLELLEEVFLDLILARLQIFGPASDLELLGRKLLVQLLDHLLLLARA